MAHKLGRFQPCNACCGGVECSVCNGGTGPESFDVTFAGFRDSVGAVDYGWEWWNQTHRFIFHTATTAQIRIPDLVTVYYCEWLATRCGCTSWGSGYVMSLKLATNGTWWRLGLYPTATVATTGVCIFYKEWDHAPTCADLEALDIPLNPTYSGNYNFAEATAAVTSAGGTTRIPAAIQDCECAKNDLANITRYVKLTVAGATGPMEEHNGEYVIEIDCASEFLHYGTFAAMYYDIAITQYVSCDLKVLSGTHYLRAAINFGGLAIVAWRQAIAAYPNCLTFDHTLANFVDGTPGYFSASTCHVESV